MSTRLDTLHGHPELIIEVGGREYRFSELTMDHRAELQAFLRRTVPHPVDAIKPHLDGLRPEDRQALLENARREAKSWPPDVGTRSGMKMLTDTEAGQVELLSAALKIHHPEAGPDDARRLYADMEREAFRVARAAIAKGEMPPTEGDAHRIYCVILGMGDPESREGTPVPEGDGPGRTRVSTGPCSTAAANGSSA